jgi:hypothetical protein
VSVASAVPPAGTVTDGGALRPVAATVHTPAPLPASRSVMRALPD